jgi:hypothetical protein
VRPGSPDATYVVTPPNGRSFVTYCDMLRGGWTLLLKSNGDATLSFAAPAWTDESVLGDGAVNLTSGNAKSLGFAVLPVTELRGELVTGSGTIVYTKPVGEAKTALEVFQGGPVVGAYPEPRPTHPSWSVQPHCQEFGFNTAHVSFAQTRFGWTANQEDNCDSNDTAIGLGLRETAVSPIVEHGAGFMCFSSECSQGNVDLGADGRLWGR